MGNQEMRISVGLRLVKLISGALKGTMKEKDKSYWAQEKDVKFSSNTLTYDEVLLIKRVNNLKSFVESCLF